MLRLFATLGFGIVGISAWSCNGHMAIAQIALDSGLISSANVAKAEELIAALAPQYPKTGPSLQEAACWADDIRSSRPSTAPWHFIDIPVCELPGGGCPQPPTENVVWAIGQDETTLLDPNSSPLDMEEAIRFLIHFVGDVHQPLHSAAYFSDPEFPAPDGDRGGNSWKIAGTGTITNLHSYWDQGLGQWSQTIPRPLQPSGHAWLVNISETVRALFPSTSLSKNISITDPMAWAEESYNFAKDFVYTAPQSPTKVPASYTNEGQDIALMRIAIAGYRLAEKIDATLSLLPEVNSTRADDVKYE